MTGKTLPRAFRTKVLDDLKAAILRHEADIDAALKAEFMVNVRVRDSITAQMYKTKGLKMAYDFSTNVGFKVRVFDNAKAFDDDKVAEMTRVAWKGHSRKAGSQPVALDSGVDVAFVPKDKGFDKAYGVDVSAEVKLYRKHVVLTDDDGKYLTDFEQHLRKSGKRTNTVGKHMRQLRTIINEAINHGIIKADDYPFKKYKIKSERGHFEWLTPQELRRLENLKLTNKGQRHILDAFLFCCYTGLRYSDFVRMKPDWIEKINGKPWLHFFTKKTNTEVRLPLSLLFDGKALSIIGKYGDIGKLAHIYGNHDTNVALSHIMEAAKIGKRATFHMARHNKNYIYLNMK